METQQISVGWIQPVSNFRSGLTAVIYQMLGPRPGELTCLQRWENRPRSISIQCPAPLQPPNEPL